MTEFMIERVARAICRVDLMSIAMEENIALAPNGLDASVDKVWRSAIPNARAVLEAMREPTPAMTRVAVENGLSGNSAHVAWSWMIDAALKEGK